MATPQGIRDIQRVRFGLRKGDSACWSVIERDFGLGTMFDSAGARTHHGLALAAGLLLLSASMKKEIVLF